MNTRQVKTVSWTLKCSFCVLAGLGFNSANALTITATSDSSPTGVFSDSGTRFATASSGTVDTGVFEQDGGFDTRMSGSDVGTVLGASSIKSWVGLTGGISATNNHAATSTFSWQDTITNGDTSNSNYFYNLNIDQGALAAALNPIAGSVGNTSIYANYSLDVLVNGVSVWNSGAQIGRSATGTSQSQTGTSLGGSFGTYIPSGTLYEGGLEADIIGLSSFGYQWDAFSTSIGLGTFAPGEIIFTDV